MKNKLFCLFLFLLVIPTFCLAANVDFSKDTTLQFNPDASPSILVASGSQCDQLIISGTNLNVLIPNGATFELKNQNHTLIKLTPSGASVELVLNVASSAQQYLSGYIVKWQASSTVANASVSFEVKVPNANSWYQVNVDSSYYGSYQSNSSGIISFTYSGGFSTRTFEVEVDLTAPTSFSLTSPSNGENVTDKTPTFSWNACTDPDFSHYQIFIDGTSVANNLTSNSYTPTSVLKCGSHSWYVKAFDEAGNSTQTSTFSFKVLCGVGILIPHPTTSTSEKKTEKKTTSTKEILSKKEIKEKIKGQLVILYRRTIFLLQKLYLKLLERYLEALKSKVSQ